MHLVCPVACNKFENAGWQIIALIEKEEALAGVTSMRNAIIIVALLTCTAGETGKGFSVVTQEVLDFAQSSKLKAQSSKLKAQSSKRSSIDA